MDIRDFQNISMEVAFPDVAEEDRLPIIDWYNEDKSDYIHAKDAINPKTNRHYIDVDDDFLISESGHFLMNENFVFVNTHKLRPAAEYYEKHRVYTKAARDSYEYNRFREEEEDRRYIGYTQPCKLYKKDVESYNNLPRTERHKLVHNLHITGEQYNFINYGRIMLTDESSIKEGDIEVRKILGLPRFFYSQYWWTKAKEFARKNGFNHIVVKSRRAGWSFQEAIDTANEANLIPNITQILCGYDLKYVTKSGAIADMVRVQLNFYETETPFNRCGFKNGEAVGLLKKDLTELKLGYKDKGGTERGWLSKILGLSFGPANPDVAIGKDAKKIKIEEMSNAPNFDAFMGVTEPTTKAGSFKVGMIIGFGTGGSKEGNWKAFKGWYYNPSLYDAMPFANVWDKSAKRSAVGFFKPYIQNLEGFDVRGVSGIDQYGNPNYVSSTNIYKEERRLKSQNPKTSKSDYLRYCGQYANSPSESFTTAEDNIFVSNELIEHRKRVGYDDNLKFYRDGWLERNEKGKPIFKTNTQLQSEGKSWHTYMNSRKFKKGDDVFGCLREWYPPYKGEDGKIPDGLYRIYYDSVAIDKDTKLIRSDNSLNSVIVKMVPTNLIPGGGDIIVARYIGRMNKLEDTDRFVLDLADYYNAKVLPEVDRGDCVKNFKRWKRRDRLVKTPIHIFDVKIKDATEGTYGLQIGGGDKKANGLEYAREWLYEKRGIDEQGNQLYNFNFIYDEPLLDEYLSFNSEENFDGISTMILAAYDSKELVLARHKVKTKKKKSNSVFKRKWY